MSKTRDMFFVMSGDHKSCRNQPCCSYCSSLGFFALHLKLTFFIFSLFLDRQHFLCFDLFDAINVFTRKKLDVSLGR